MEIPLTCVDAGAGFGFAGLLDVAVGPEDGEAESRDGLPLTAWTCSTADQSEMGLSFASNLDSRSNEARGVKSEIEFPLMFKYSSCSNLEANCNEVSPVSFNARFCIPAGSLSKTSFWLRVCLKSSE